MKRFLVGVGSVAGSALMASQAMAQATTFDLGELATSVTTMSTAAGTVYIAAGAILVGIIGWKLVKRIGNKI